MTPSPQALLAVGKDCECGQPLVWRHSQQWCAVYGSHPPTLPTMGMRNRDAPGSALVDALTAMSYRRQPTLKVIR